MRKFALLALALLLTGPGALPSVAGGRIVRLGTDPAGDGPPTLDVTYIDALRTKTSLEIRIGVANMFPAIGGVPEGPGIEWIFTTGKRSFIAEAVASSTPKFFFFELKGDSFEQLQGVTGTYDAADGFIRMLVPLKLIGAKKGTVISGYHDPLEDLGKGEGSDVDAHVHDPASGTYYFDDMTTTKRFVIP